MPEYEVAQRHHIPVSAPAEIIFAAATDSTSTQPVCHDPGNLQDP
jgi:hypothetical protein